MEIGSLLLVYPIPLVNGLSKDTFEVYKDYVRSIENNDMILNSGQCTYSLETESMEEIFHVAMCLTESHIKWKFYSLPINYDDSIYRKCKFKDNMIVRPFQLFQIHIVVNLNYDEYMKFIKVLTKICRRDNFYIAVLRDFPNIRKTRSDRFDLTDIIKL